MPDAVEPTTDSQRAQRARRQRVADHEARVRTNPLTAVTRHASRTSAFAAVYRRVGPKVDPTLMKIRDGRFLAADELRDNFATLLGDIASTRVVHTCGSGVTACHNILAMEHAGLTGSRLYAGSWSEWIEDPARPVATGND